MSLNIKMEEILKAKTKLERKLSEGTITKNERSLLKEIKSSLVEAPIDYEGPERMEPGIERKIT